MKTKMQELLSYDPDVAIHIFGVGKLSLGEGFLDMGLGGSSVHEDGFNVRLIAPICGKEHIYLRRFPPATSMEDVCEHLLNKLLSTKANIENALANKPGNSSVTSD